MNVEDQLAKVQVQLLLVTQALEQAMARLRGIRDGYDRSATTIRHIAGQAVKDIQLEIDRDKNINEVTENERYTTADSRRLVDSE